MRLLTLLGAAAPIRFRHTGDLDRAGLLILRSLRGRTGLPVEPWRMSEAVFERCEAHALPMSAGERAETERLLARWAEPYGRDLLHRLVEGGRWIEQEAIIETFRWIGGPVRCSAAVGDSPETGRATSPVREAAPRNQRNWMELSRRPSTRR